jgi:hypothetical protein
VLVGLILATALNAAIPFRTFFRAAYFVPYVTASVAVIAATITGANFFTEPYLLTGAAARPGRRSRRCC